MKIIRLLLLSGIMVLMQSCGNREKKPILPYFQTENNDIHPVWILPNQDLSKFIKLPELEILNQNGEKISLSDSTKRFQILSFFNTECGDPCKALMHNLKWLDEQFSEASNYCLTSLSTSTVDTAAVLLDFAKANTIELTNRSLLCSTTEILNLVIKETLNTSLSEKQEREIYETLYLIDNQGYLRGIYDGTNTVDLENIILDSRIL